MQPYLKHTTRNTSHFIQVIQEETLQLISNVINPIMLLLTELLVLFCIVLFVPTISLENIVALATGAWCCDLYLVLRKNFWGEKQNFHKTMRIKNLQHGFYVSVTLKSCGQNRSF